MMTKVTSWIRHIMYILGTRTISMEERMMVEVSYTSVLNISMYG